MRISKKILAIALSILMAVSMMPFTVFAATVREVATAADFEAAVTAASAGDTIKLTDNITFDYANKAQQRIDISNLTIDLNGYKITTNSRWCVLYEGTNGTIKNGTMEALDNSDASKYQYGIYIWGGDDANELPDPNQRPTITLENLTVNYGIHLYNSEVTIKNCDVTGSDKYYAIWSDIGSKAIVESGNFTTSGAAVLGAAKYGDSYTGNIEVKGGTYTVPEGKKLVQTGSSCKPEKVQFSGGTCENADGTPYTVLPVNIADGAVEDPTTGEVTQKYVAKIGSNYYETFNAAISAASEGDTVIVISDATLTSTDIAINKDLTIDFGSHTITASRWPLINKANLTLTGTTGGLVSARGLVDNYGTLTIDGGVYNNTPTAYPAIWNNPGGEIIINGGTITSNNAVVYNEGAGSVLTINDGTLNSNSSYKADSTYYSYAIRNLSGSSCTMNGGTINAVHGGIAATGATVVVNDGTITVHDSELGNDGHYAIYVSGNNTDVTVNDGTFTGAKNAVLIDDDDIGLTENTALSIIGGTFTAASGYKAVDRGQNDSYPVVSGGEFSSVVPAEFCAPNYTPVTEPNEQGMYEVETVTSDNGYSLTVDHSIAMNAYIDVDAYVNDVDDATVNVTYNDADALDPSQKGTKTEAFGYNDVTKDDEGRWTLTINQAPAQIADEVKIQVIEDGIVKGEIVTSVADYLVQASTSDDAKLANLAKAMFDYGKATYEESGYVGEDNFADLNDDKYFNTTDTDASVAGREVFNKVNVDGFEFNGLAFVATSTPSLRAYCNFTEAQAVAANLDHLDVSDKTGKVCANLGSVNPEDFDKELSVVINNGASITTNVIKYANLAGGQLGVSMRNYFAAARNYWA